MKRKVADYSDFVEHPRYGRGPRYTDIRPRQISLGYRLTTYLSDNKIEGTAVEANLERQTFSPVPVLYYFDLRRKCVECGRPFLFFAEEQKHWYETLGFVVDSDCVRCTDCRKQSHDIERQRRRYEELFHRDDRTVEESLELAECSLILIENGAFDLRQTQRVRSLLNSVANDLDKAARRKYDEIVQRVLEVERDGIPSNHRRPPLR